MPEDLYPALEPYASDWLEVGDGHRLWFEQCGNAQGAPVVFLHGGPGSSCNANHRRYFDPAFYRIVLFDQRGCGRSLPLGAIEHNTTAHLVADMEHLRSHLGIENWLLFGGSWGSTLALAYALAHRQYVSGLILRGVFLASAAELDWYLAGLRRFVPEAWARLSDGAAEVSSAGLLNHYRAVIADGATQMAAARRWNSYEAAVMAIGEAASATASASAPAQTADQALLARVRIQLHYLAAGCFLRENELLAGASVLASLPGMIVQGRRDLVCPPVGAYTLAQSWPGVSLHMVEDAGHSALHPAMVAALVAATDRMRGSLRKR